MYPTFARMTHHEEYDEELFDEHWITADPGQGPVRLDKFLGDRMQGVSRNKIQNAIHAGAIQVNDAQVKPNYKVRPLDRIRVLMPRRIEGEDEVQPEDLPLDIVYEDNDVLIV
ncbi:MAG: S4 domain-containing protein, partial [Saprospiraceae bacterium]|nr:S4 domain-containing protein [Saprospiraceae bacterium]